MRISEVIEKLTKIKEIVGDIPCNILLEKIPPLLKDELPVSYEAPLTGISFDAEVVVLGWKIKDAH